MIRYYIALHTLILTTSLGIAIGRPSPSRPVPIETPATKHIEQTERMTIPSPVVTKPSLPSPSPPQEPQVLLVEPHFVKSTSVQDYELISPWDNGTGAGLVIPDDESVTTGRMTLAKPGPSATAWPKLPIVDVGSVLPSR